MNEKEFASKLKPWLERGAAQVGDQDTQVVAPGGTLLAQQLVGVLGLEPALGLPVHELARHQVERRALRGAEHRHEAIVPRPTDTAPARREVVMRLSPTRDRATMGHGLPRAPRLTQPPPR